MLDHLDLLPALNLPALNLLPVLEVVAGVIPDVAPSAPPGSEKILSIVGFIKWIAGAALIACFLGGIVAFTAGRLFDHHRTGRIGLIFMMSAAVGAILFAVGPQILNTLAR
jgi:MFS family permease